MDFRDVSPMNHPYKNEARAGGLRRIDAVPFLRWEHSGGLTVRELFPGARPHQPEFPGDRSGIGDPVDRIVWIVPQKCPLPDSERYALRPLSFREEAL